MLHKAFTDHPASVGETYTEHLAMASGFGTRMIFGGIACLLHGIFPFLFVKTGSRCIADLHSTMVANRVRKPQLAAPRPGQPAWDYVI
jgi:hypothetical protein